MPYPFSFPLYILEHAPLEYKIQAIVEATEARYTIKLDGDVREQTQSSKLRGLLRYRSGEERAISYSVYKTAEGYNASLTCPDCIEASTDMFCSHAVALAFQLMDLPALARADLLVAYMNEMPNCEWSYPPRKGEVKRWTRKRALDGLDLRACLRTLVAPTLWATLQKQHEEMRAEIAGM